MFATDDLPIVPLPDSPESASSAFKALEGLSLDDALSKIANSIVDFAFKLLIAILIFYIGRFIINKLYKMVKNIMLNRHVDMSLTTFVLSLLRMVLYFILIITIVGILGLETSSFLAIFASAGVAIGMALSGTLQNFAGGVLILLLKPYRVGDFIEAQGYSGTVKAIQIFHTVINTPDNKSIIIPNGGLSTGSINNYSSENYRRVDWTIGLSYSTDFDAAANAIKEILLSDDRTVEKYICDDMEKRLRSGLNETYDNEKNDEGADSQEDDAADNPGKVVKAPGTWLGRLFESKKHKTMRLHQSIKERVGLATAMIPHTDCSPFVGLNELGDSSINLTVRAWTHSSNYWPLYFEMNRRFYSELPKRGFEFPFPQLDVHTFNN